MFRMRTIGLKNLEQKDDAVRLYLIVNVLVCAVKELKKKYEYSTTVGLFTHYTCTCISKILGIKTSSICIFLCIGIQIHSC